MKRVGDKNVIVLPASMHHNIIRKTHDNGHFGVKKMSENIQNEYYIPKLREKNRKIHQLLYYVFLPRRNEERRRVNSYRYQKEIFRYQLNIWITSDL